MSSKVRLLIFIVFLLLFLLRLGMPPHILIRGFCDNFANRRAKEKSPELFEILEDVVAKNSISQAELSGILIHCDRIKIKEAQKKADRLINKVSIGLLNDKSGYIDIGENRYLFQNGNFVDKEKNKAGTPIAFNLRTGGTIGMNSTEEGKSFRDGKDKVTTFSKHYQLGKQIFNHPLDSSQLGPKEFSQIVNSVKEVLDAGMVPVITHGTDTMEITAHFLSFLFPNEKIIITGAFDSPDASNSDAPINYADAINLSLSENIPNKPFVVMNKKINLGSRVVKVDIDKEKGFKSYGGVVGRINDKGEVQFSENFLNWSRDFMPEVKFSPEDFKISNIDLIYANKHTPLEFIEGVKNRLLQKNAKDKKVGLVIEGELFQEALNVLRELTAKSIPVFIEEFSSESNQKMNKIPGSLTPLQTWMKLAVLLNKFEYGKAKDLMSVNLAGEMLLDTYEDIHPKYKPGHDFYKTVKSNNSFVLYFPGENIRDIINDEINRLSKEEGTKRIIIEGVGNGHIDLDLSDLILKAKKNDIEIKMLTRPAYAVANLDYEIGRKLKQMGVELTGLQGRRYLYSFGSEKSNP